MRFKYVNGARVAMTAEEEAACDARDQEWLDGQAARDAEAARLTLDRNERLTLMGDTAIRDLVNATPTQLLNWARNNFPSLTQPEQDNMARVLYALAVAVRPHVR